MALLKAGNLTILGDAPLSDCTVLLEFQYKCGNRQILSWHGLLTVRRLLLDTPACLLEQWDQASLTATLEFVELKTDVNFVFVNVSKIQKNRGDFLRAFSYMGFEIVRPGQQSCPSCKDHIFMVYVMEREVPGAETTAHSKDASHSSVYTAHRM